VKGELKEAWVVDYVDQRGKRSFETFARRKMLTLATSS
jgi:hypothetical protein